MPNPLPFTSTADILADIGQALDDARETFGDAGKPADFKGLTFAGAVREMTRLHAEMKAKWDAHEACKAAQVPRGTKESRADEFHAAMKERWEQAKAKQFLD